MAGTRPAKDLLGNHQNKRGVVYSTTRPTRVFAEEMNALYGTLIGGTYSANPRDLYVSGIPVIDNLGNWIGNPIGFTVPDPLLLSGKLLADTTGPSSRPRVRVNDNDTTPDLFAQVDHVAIRQTSTTASDYVLSDITGAEAIPGSFATLTYAVPGLFSVGSNNWNEYTDLQPGNLFAFDGTHELDWINGRLDVYNTTTPALVTVDVTGGTGSVAVNGDVVLRTRGAAVADAAGGATVDAEARAAINAVLARLRASTGHGLIAG